MAALPSSDGDSTSRVEVIDALRGIALFGVFLMNFAGSSGRGVFSTEEQLLALPTAPLDFPLGELAWWLVADKANTLFAFLFGVGFWLQLQRGEHLGPLFVRRYCRRMAVLLALGLIHIGLIFFWDILHLYALAGFALLALRRLSARALFWGGVALAIASRVAHEAYLDYVVPRFGWPEPFSNSAALARQQLAHDGDYAGLVRAFAEFNFWDWIAGAGLVAWFLYALGRFMLGAWVAQRGWLQNSAQHLAGFRRVLRIALPGGLILEAVARLLPTAAKWPGLTDAAPWDFLAKALHLIAVPVLAAGYACAVVVAWHSERGRRLLAPFASVGRMALTNYVTQSFIFAFVLTAIGPGLGLAGEIGFTGVAAIVVVAYTAQVLATRWWLSRFRQGPLEWLWRSLATGVWLPLRITVPARAPRPA